MVTPRPHHGSSPRTSRFAAATTSATLLAAALLGCAESTPAPRFGAPNEGSQWVQVESAHFHMYTDSPADIARLTLTEYEMERDRVAFVLPHPESGAQPKISIVLFERKADFYAATGEMATVQAFFVPSLRGDMEDSPTLVLKRDKSFSWESWSVFRHELTHSFLHARSARLPLWLDEGLAEYYSMLRFDSDRLILGDPPPERVFSVAPPESTPWSIGRFGPFKPAPYWTAPSVPVLLGARREDLHPKDHEELTDEDKARQAAIYAAAFRLVHMLRNAPDPSSAARFDAFVSAVENGMNAGQAFSATYGDPASPGLDQYYRQYLVLPRLPVSKVPFSLGRGVPLTAVRPMSNSEVLVLQARLRPTDPASREQTRKDLNLAASLEPRSLEVRYRRALFAAGEKRFDDARADLDMALLAAPWDPRYLQASVEIGRAAAGGALDADDARQMGRYAALAQVAVTARQINTVAWGLVLLGRPSEGLPFIERALAVDRTCASCEDTRAVLLFQLGRVSEAMSSMDRAVALLPDEHPSRRFLLRRRVLQLAARLLPGDSAPSPAGDATPRSGLSAEVLGAIEKMYAPELSACPEQASPQPPVIQFVIRPDGGVRSAKPASPSDDPKASACTLEVVRAMLFPPFVGAPIEAKLPPDPAPPKPPPSVDAPASGGDR